MTTDLQSTRNMSAQYNERGAMMRTSDLITTVIDVINIFNEMISNSDQMIIVINHIINKINDLINNSSNIITMLITHLETSSGVGQKRGLSW